MEFAQYGTREDLAYAIYLKKFDQHPNRYHAYAYRASLKSDPVKSRVFEVRSDPCFTLPDAFNLLNARAVQKLVLDWPSRQMKSSWFQLDFSKKDTNGNVRLDKLNVSDKNFAVSKALSRYPVKELMNPDERVNLFLSLLKGNAEPVTVIKNGKEMKAFAQADPGNTTVHVFANWNGKMMKVALPDNNSTQKQVQDSLRKENPARRKGMAM
jgi:hypothetical protein